MKTITRRKLKLPLIIFASITMIFNILLIIFLNNLHIIPLLYMVVISLILLMLWIGNFFLLKSKKKPLHWISYVISVLFIIISVFGIYYAERTNAFLNKAFGNNENITINTYYLITLNSNNYTDIKNIDNTKIGYYDKTPNVDEALKELNNKIKSDNIKYEDFETTFNALKNGEISAAIVEKSLYQFILEYDSDFEKDLYNILYTYDVKIIEEEEEIDKEADSFNIYIGGTDFTEMYTDFNMIVSINKTTHKILLTSTPRDFYIELDGKGGARDLLGYAGVWGINTSRKSLENLYNINIDYYIKINTKSLVGLVDTLNGVEFCSDISFTTTHALVMGTYDDTLGQKLRVNAGCRSYSGIEILTIARERKAYPDGDRQRQKNCQQIMINLINKMTRAENITNYVSILDAVSDLYTTNIPKDLVTELARDTINKPKWAFEQQSVTGKDSRGNVHLSSYIDYVMIPDMDSVNAATEKINQVMSEK